MTGIPLEEFLKLEGQTVGTSRWFVLDQSRIDRFADVTDDHQFIHVDPELAKQTPFGTTIAHGFLTLSMLVKLTASIPNEIPLEGIQMGINYGFDKVRFINPVLSGKRIRASAVTSAVELKGTAVNSTRTITVEIEGEGKPALVADWIGRTVYDS